MRIKDARTHMNKIIRSIKLIMMMSHEIDVYLSSTKFDLSPVAHTQYIYIYNGNRLHNVDSRSSFCSWRVFYIQNRTTCIYMCVCVHWSLMLFLSDTYRTESIELYGDIFFHHHKTWFALPKMSKHEASWLKGMLILIYNTQEKIFPWHTQPGERTSIK
jgi:hypothetical protein